MRCIIVVAAGLFIAALPAFAQSDRIRADFVPPPHPRILLPRGEEAGLARDIAADTTWRRFHSAIIANAIGVLETAPLERIQVGRRLLATSREALRRTFLLSYAWRTTREQRFATRAQRELLAVAAFSDWNPSHFLDVAEMTMAVSIGYDWLYDALPDSARVVIRSAIRTKGLEPSLDPKTNSWLRASHNWNQVCNAGMAYGAIAVYEDDPVLARTIVNRAIETVALPMEDYKPDGGYPEGYGYWAYGTNFNVMLIAALERLFGDDFGLSVRPGFLKTAGFMEHMTAPSGTGFNFSDSGLHSEHPDPAMFWLADKLRAPSLLWIERGRLMTGNASGYAKHRLLPAAMVFGHRIPLNRPAVPASLMWTGGGKTPVAMMRTSWTDPNAIYVGIKGGTPSTNHSHMDAGSFVMEANGVRWAMDFGAENYNQLETQRVDLWNMSQTSQRWQVFRYNNMAHNTLTMNGGLQVVAGRATLTRTSDAPRFMSAIVDLSGVYAGAVASAQRGIAIVNRSHVVVRDEIETLASPTTVRWNMVTPGTVRITGPNSAELTKDGRKLLLRVRSPHDVVMKTWSTVSTNAYDSPNPGTTMVGFEATLPAGARGVIVVELIPGAARRSGDGVPPLSRWPSTRKP